MSFEVFLVCYIDSLLAFFSSVESENLGDGCSVAACQIRHRCVEVSGADIFLLTAFLSLRCLFKGKGHLHVGALFIDRTDVFVRLLRQYCLASNQQRLIPIFNPDDTHLQ